MISTIQDLLVYSEEDFDLLPAEGLFEVVDGRAILLPPNDNEHQFLSGALFTAFYRELQALGYGCVVSTPNVRIPAAPYALGGMYSRVPDVVVSKHKPKRRFEVGKPPELVIEILATRRGNVERTEKMDDYARAGVGEYWIVDPFARKFEVHVLRDDEYVRAAESSPLRPEAFPGLEIDPQEIWAALD